ncbi:RNA 2',3'-cyclic phosphodiesterase [Ornithinibacillus xuwenensis]|uniref:RNA 2',3'-cyclic phosphodiesterase n=1 Tax=Ornithinibacillus xuwenensis TaxID=3144668 RepID=A0ABU9XLP8_9BACI
MTATPHYFIAVPVTNEIKVEFSKWQNALQQKLSYKIWPHQEDLHITLKFLGGVEADKVKELLTELRSIDDISDFFIEVGGLGTFGKPDSPRVLWAGAESNKNLLDLYKRVERASTKMGFSKEHRPYRPHITLAKKWNGSSIHTDALKDVLDSAQFEIFSMVVNSFVLYQIFPSKIPKYEIVETFNLKGGR